MKILFKITREQKIERTVPSSGKIGTAWDKVKGQAYKSVKDVRLKGEKHIHSDTYQRRHDADKKRQEERGCERGEK